MNYNFVNKPILLIEIIYKNSFIGDFSPIAPPRWQKSLIRIYRLRRVVMFVNFLLLSLDFLGGLSAGLHSNSRCK